MNNKQQLIFDLDGTLTNPEEGIVNSFQYAISALGRPPVDPKHAASFIGPPLRTTFNRILGEECSPEEVEKGVALYRERYAESGLFENYPYPGILEALRQLKNEGFLLLVVTSKLTLFAEQILEKFALRQFFTGVHGTELDGRLDNKVNLMSHVKALYQLSEEHTIVTGDRREDMLAASANGFKRIGVTYGFGSMEELNEAGANELCHAPGEIRGIVHRLCA